MPRTRHWEIWSEPVCQVNTGMLFYLLVLFPGVCPRRCPQIKLAFYRLGQIGDLVFRSDLGAQSWELDPGNCGPFRTKHLVRQEELKGG